MSARIDLRPVNPSDSAFADLLRGRIKDLKFEDKDDGVDTLTLTLANNDRVLSDTEKAVEGKSFLISWGEEGNMTPLREITLTKVKGNGQDVVYEGKGSLYKHDQTPVYRRWEAVEISELVRKVAREMGYNSPDISGLEMEFITEQQNQPNSRFLAKLARGAGVAFWTDSRNLHFRSRDVVTPTRAVFVYKGVSGDGFGRIIGEPSIEFEYTRSKPKNVTVVSVPQKKKAETKVVKVLGLVPVVVRSGEESDKKTEVKGSDKKGSYAGWWALPSNHEEKVYATRKQVRRTKPQWQRKSRDKQKGELPIHGDASLYPGDTIELYNYGAINDGKWYVRGIDHAVETRGEFTQVLKISRTSGAKKKNKGGTRVKGAVQQQTWTDWWLYPKIQANEKGKVRLKPSQYGKSKTVYKKKRRGYR